MIRSAQREWLSNAIRCIEADFNRSADTHLIRVQLPPRTGVTLYLKDESSHPSGSLKHRLARSLFLYALCNGRIAAGTTIVEASSGSTAVSEAYFAKLLGLPFVAVVPKTTSTEKIAAIESYGGRCHLVADAKQVHGESMRLAREVGGHFMDQFTFAERATDWRGNNNIAESIFAQMHREPHPIPAWIVCGAGTGGTSATLGRYIRYQCHDTGLCVADPTGSIFHRHFDDPTLTEIDDCESLIQGIGRPRVEASFLPETIDRMLAIPDTASIAAMRVISEILGKPCGGSTGTNIWACAQLVGEMMQTSLQASIVTLLCDSGDRYRSTLFDDRWLVAQGVDIEPHRDRLRRFFEDGTPLA